MISQKESQERKERAYHLYQQGNNLQQIRAITKWDITAIRGYLIRSGLCPQHDRVCRGKPLPKIDIKLSKTERAYIAGLFDGEGSININVSRRQVWLQCDVTNTDIACLNYIQKRFPAALFSKSYTKYDLKNINRKSWKPIHRWQCISSKAYVFLKIIKPYLIIKKEQANIAIEFFEMKQQFSGHIGDRMKKELEFKDKLQSFRTPHPLRSL